MIGKDVYKVWAPYGEKWVNWVRPVPFNFMNEDIKNKCYMNIKTYDLDYVKNSKIISYFIFKIYQN